MKKVGQAEATTVRPDEQETKAKLPLNLHKDNIEHKCFKIKEYHI